MKYISAYFLLTSFAAAPASAALPHHCDVAWLEKARDAASQGSTPADPKHYLTMEAFPGGERAVLEMDDRPKVCDSQVWSFLTESEAGYGLGWGKTLGPQVRVLLTVDALHYAADSQGVKVDGKSSESVSTVIRMEVLRQLEDTDDYLDLSALYDEKKTNAAWTGSSEGLAVAAQLKMWRADAEATSVVDELDGRVFCYSSGGQKVKDYGIQVSELFRSRAYRATIARSVVNNMLWDSLNAEATAALAAYRSERAAATPP